MKVLSAAWPEPLPTADPYGDPPRVDGLRAWKCHAFRKKSDHLTPEAFAPLLDAFLARVGAIRQGKVTTPDPELERLARRVGVWVRARADRRHPVRSDTLPTMAVLARLAADIAPSVGNEAPDRLLGPWSTLLDRRLPAHQHVLHTTLAAACFLPSEDDAPWHRSPHRRWVRREPIPPVEVRHQYTAIAQAPLAPWKIEEWVPQGVVLSPLVTLGDPHRPDQPVACAPPASVDGGGAPGDTLLARVVSLNQGWEAVAPLAVRHTPPLDLLRSWLHLELMCLRLTTSNPTFDDLLRARGHLLVRYVHEWAWRARP